MAIATVAGGAELRRISLQIERDELYQQRLKDLLKVATAATAAHRQDLRNAKARFSPK